MKRINSAIVCTLALTVLVSCNNSTKAPENLAQTRDNGASAIAAQTNPRTVDWAYTFKYADQRDTVAANPQVIFYGDSITEMWGVWDMDFFKTHSWLELGTSGMTTSQLLCRFRTDVINLHPKYVVILGGINDVAENNGPVDLQNTLGNLIDMAELSRYNGIIPVLCSLTPCSRFFWREDLGNPSQIVIGFNEKLKAYCEKSGTIYVDYHSALKNADDILDPDMTVDGCHLTLKSYKIMEDMVCKVIK